MEKFVERTLLYDFYGELLTKRQQQIYESVVLEDYSLSEVAEELNISRQGDRKSTRLNSSHDRQSRMPSSA